MKFYWGIVIIFSLLVSFGFSNNTYQTGKPPVFAMSDTLTADTVIRFEAKPESGYNFPFFIYIPSGTKLGSRHFLLVETNNTGLNDTLLFHETNAKLQAKKQSSGNSISRRLKIPFLVPAFPRGKTEWKIYTHALDRDAILIKSGDQKRLDLQLIAMINAAGEGLQGFKISLQKKVFLNGFSASGTFANRFSLIHPDRVAAVACGGINAIPILPVNSIGATNLDYPLGTHDFKKIFGNPADLEKYKKIPQFIYMGELDDNDAVLFDDGYDERERKNVFNVIGKKMMPDRWEKCRSVYESVGTNAEFKIYPGIGHGTNGKIHTDIESFFRKFM